MHPLTQYGCWTVFPLSGSAPFYRLVVRIIPTSKVKGRCANLSPATDKRVTTLIDYYKCTLLCAAIGSINRHGSLEHMIARISTQLACTADELWQHISRPKSLQFVASPLLTFEPMNSGLFDREWDVGRDYQLKLYFLKFIPLGSHTIHLEKIDKDSNEISSRESGLLASVWNHKIRFQELRPGLLSYTDEIEIRAGLLTPLIWMFAHFFYRHRQRRWKILLKNNGIVE